MSITIREVEGTTDLYLHYDQQTETQPVYLYLDCENHELYASVSGEIGNCWPVAIHNKTAIRWRIPTLTAQAVNALMREIEPLAEKIMAGYKGEWNDVNYRGTFTEEAQDAIEEIECTIQQAQFNEDELVSETYCVEWCNDISYYGKITAETTDEELKALAAKIEADVPENVVLQDDMIDYLTDIRGEIQEEEVEKDS